MYSSTLLGAAAVLALAGGVNAGPVSRRQGPPVGQVLSQCTQTGLVALTFDDGPFTFTPQLLDTLAANDVKATFFVNGNNFGNIETAPNPDTIIRMKNEGHLIGSHTFSHPDLNTLSSADRISQMTQLEDATRRIAGFAPKYMRAPFLSCDDACLGDLAGLGYHVIDTSLDTKDYENTTPETTHISAEKFDNELSPDPASNSYIVLSHDVHEQTVVSLVQKMIDTLKAKGYRAVTVGECLGDAPENWYKA
ncbi:chitin deacetylase [Colletotrichum tofieldiae]|uniref:Chitin deacetylase (Polysaccharide deacetylase) n=1 Tax=Colletotrichum tofieldiae TaxID=708197 RepID=A0A166R4X1_9PEZI|nr:chitin deacetylase (polysaccharide deacetylase) [Colletotrichum tofieldiae]GKT54138.1 chitin deacetylase [Colletotrichum tofieldiae]GKT73869.1 chitin deacetylase [Colletotrichum tofieldiae]GKT95839.1 chitin deacetylase [Colletotrichum tofieldiae]